MPGALDDIIAGAPAAPKSELDDLIASAPTKTTGPTFAAPGKKPWYSELFHRIANVVIGPDAALNSSLGKYVPGTPIAVDFGPAPTDKPILDISALGLEDLVPGQETTSKVARGAVRGVESFGTGLTTPTNAEILAGTAGLGEVLPVASKLLSLGFSAQMLRDAFEKSPKFAKQVHAGDVEGATRTLTEIGLTAAAGIMAAKHAASPDGIAPVKASDISRETARRMAPSENATSLRPTDEALEQILKVAPPGPKREALVEDAKARGIEVPELQTREQQVTETLAPVADQDAHYNDLFDKADQKMRDRTQNPPKERKAAPRASVPEEGTPEQVTRVQYARENLARQMEGKSFGDLPNSSRMAIDDLIRQGYGQVGEPPELPGIKTENSAENGPISGQLDENTTNKNGLVLGKDEPFSPPLKPSREPQKPVHYGNDTQVAIPGENRSYRGVYAVREASDIYPSHNPFSFEVNPDYHHVNDRNYSEPRNAERIVKQESEFDPSFLVNDNPDATNGPAIIDAQGNVLGGNSRSMTLSRVRANRPEASAAYRQLLEEKSKRFGIAPELVKRMENPVLVRQLTEDVDAQRAITDLNKTGTAALTQAERAISDSKRISPETADYLTGRIDERGPEGTLAQALEGAGGKDIVNRLVDDGVITQQEKPTLLNADGSLTPDGKKRIASSLSGRFFASARELEDTAPELRAKLDRVVAPVMRTAGRPEWDLTEPTKEAVSLLKDAKSRGVPVDDIVRQQGLFGGDNYTPDAIAIARKLEEKPTEVARAFRQYANEEALSRPDAPMTIGFEAPTREEAFREAFGGDEVADESSDAYAAIPPDDELGPLMTGFHHNVNGAIKALKALKTGNAIAALHHPAVGDIDLIWGKGGSKGYGLAKIAERHPEVLKDLQGIIGKLAEKSRNENSIQLGDDRYTAVVRRNWKGNPKDWLLTAFEKKEPSAGGTIDDPGARATDRQAPPSGGDPNLPPEGAAAQPAGRSSRRSLRKQTAAPPATQAPTPAQAGSAWARVKDDFLSAIAPAARTNAARETSFALREMSAELARRDAVAQTAYSETRKMFAARSQADNWDFMARADSGRPQSHLGLQQVANSMDAILKGLAREVQATGTGALESLRENYFPRNWKNPRGAADFIARFLTKRPLQGPKGFLKQRSYPTFEDAIADGLRPISDNPVDIFLLKVHEMNQYILAHQMWNDPQSGVEYFPASKKPPVGHIRINDPMATVFGKPSVTVEESFDKPLMDQLNAFAQSIGVRTSRDTRLPGAPKSALGFAKPTGYVMTKFGSPEQVLAHEIGHQIEYKYKVSRALRKPGIAKELNDLAALRWEGVTPTAKYKAYARSIDEKMANAIAAMIYAPERFRQSAPKTWDLLRDELYANPATRPLLNIQKSMTLGRNEAEIPVGGMVIRGHYWAPEDRATVINNYLSPGLRDNTIFNAVRGAANFLNQAQLSVPGFHFMTTSMEAMISKDALAIRRARAGQASEALRSHLSAVMAPFTYYLDGKRLQAELLQPGTQGAEMMQLADAVIKAGGRAHVDPFYETNQARKMADAFRRGGLGGAVEGIGRLPFALPDLLSHPLMKVWVPRVKLGAFADLARFELSRMPEGTTLRDAQPALSRAWDSVDNRMGQLVMDNLFWNKVLKQLAMIAVRSVGWNLGSLREGGGGMADAALGNSEGERVTNRSAYLAAAAVRTAIMGSITYYLLTGKAPQQIKDVFFPGGHSMPGYAKDSVNWASHPLDTARNKVNPIWPLTYEMLSNEDYYRNPISRADLLSMQRALDYGKYGLQQILPLGVRDTIQHGGITEDDVYQFFGMPRAPKELRDDE